MLAFLASSIVDGLGAISVEARGEGTRAWVIDRRTVFTIKVPVELRSRGDLAPAPPRGSPAGHDRNDTTRISLKSIRRSGPCVGPVRLSPLRRWAVAVASVCAFVTAPGAGRAGEEKADGKPEALVLFDGKSLDGWKKTDFSRPGAV